MSKTLVTIAPAGKPFPVTTTYYPDHYGRGRITVKVILFGRPVQQRTVPYDHSAHDPHIAAIREAFGRTGDQLIVTETNRPSRWPTAHLPRRWTVKVGA